MSSSDTVILEKLAALSPDRQQQVIDFIDFLIDRTAFSTNHTAPENDISQISALELAGDLVGCVADAPPDLSTNPDHMDGFGQA